jgi:proline iminopeptidase
MTRVLKTTAPLYFSRWDAAASEFAERAFGIDCAEALRLFNADPPDLTDDLGRISAPTLVIAGEDDFLCGPASAHEIADGREQSAGADP